MPLFRYRNLDDARRDLWLPPGAGTLAQEWQALYRLSLLAPPAPPLRGVRKFRDINEANRDTDAWVLERVQAARRRIRPTA